jgi:hypothetical protein
MKRANSRNEQSPGTPDARGRLISELIYLCVKTPKYNVNKSPKKNREGGDEAGPTHVRTEILW